MIRLVRVAVIWVLAVSAVAVVAQPAAAGGTALPFTSFFRIAVDDAHGVEFVSGGQGTAALARFDTDGLALPSITLQGPSGMALIGTELFVAEADAPDIVVLDATVDPPAVTRTIDVGSFTQPRDLVFVQGRLWFFTATGLASVLPDGTDLRGPFTSAGSSTQRFAAGLEGGTNLIFSDGSAFTVLSATVRPTTLQQDWSGSGSMAVVPGNASMVSARSSSFVETRLCDLATLRSYLGQAYASAVAITTAHGGLIAGGSNNGYGDDLWVYRNGLTASLFSYDFGTTQDLVAANGIAWSGDGGRLFVVTDGYSSDPSFNVVVPTGLPSLQWPTLVVTPTATTVPIGQLIDVTVHLEGGDTNRDVKLYSQPVNGVRTLIGSGTVDGTGDLVIAGYQPPRATTLTASYDGDASWGLANTAVSIDVGSQTTVALQKRVGTAGRYALYEPQTQIPLLATLLPAVGDGTATVVVQLNKGNGWRKLWSVYNKYASNGTFRWLMYTLESGPRYRVMVRSHGAAAYLPSISAWQYLRFVR